MQYKSAQREEDGVGRWVKLAGYFTLESSTHVLCETKSQQWITLVNLLTTTFMSQKRWIYHLETQIIILAFGHFEGVLLTSNWCKKRHIFKIRIWNIFKCQSK